MSEPTIRVHREADLTWPTYIGFCCREWVLAVGVPVGTCGYCGEHPKYLRDDT